VFLLDITAFEAMAKLDLPEDERAEIARRVEGLLNSFEAIKSIGVFGAEPLVTVLDIKNVLREDISQQLISREELLSGAPEQYEGYFWAPRTLE
jgi:aspartyl-tRNA(Asn)/glutamyl-tRNA(Gln) amidotransferase subunit C